MGIFLRIFSNNQKRHRNYECEVQEALRNNELMIYIWTVGLRRRKRYNALKREEPLDLLVQ